MTRVWLPFAVKVLVSVLVFALVAPVLLPFYSGLQIGFVQPFVAPDFKLRLEPDGSIHVYYRNYSKPAVEREMTSFTGLGLLIALFLARPIPWRKRLARLGIGFLILLVFHLIALQGLIAVWHTLFVTGKVSFLSRWAYTVIASGDLLIPAVIWGVVGLSAWKREIPSPTEKGGNAYASV